MKKLIFILVFLFLANFSYAYNITFKWDANTEPDLAGYRLYTSMESAHYDPNIYSSHVIDKGSTTYTLTDIETSILLYFVMTAFDEAGNESNYSNEVRFDPTDRPPASPSNVKIIIIINQDNK